VHSEERAISHYTHLPTSLKRFRTKAEERRMNEDRIDHAELQRLRNEQRTKCLSNLKACLAAQAHVVAVMADMDRMMLMNDQCGYVIGDTVLLAVAQRFAEEFGDNFYQIGDGFWAFTAGSEASSAATSLDSLRLHVGNLRFEGHPDLKASISVGKAFSDGSGIKAEDFFRMAENGLRQAKRQGGNCIKTYSS
jgi:diguanylate cyclase (GGDEF)-like protein